MIRINLSTFNLIRIRRIRSKVGQNLVLASKDFFLFKIFYYLGNGMVRDEHTDNSPCLCPWMIILRFVPGKKK